MGRFTGGSLFDVELHIPCLNLDIYAISAATQHLTNFDTAVKIANFGRQIWAAETSSNEVKTFKFIYVNIILYYIAVVSVKFGM